MRRESWLARGDVAPPSEADYDDSDEDGSESGEEPSEEEEEDDEGEEEEEEDEPSEVIGALYVKYCAPLPPARPRAMDTRGLSSIGEHDE